ncbi:Smr domain-containing protein C11H11.03c [Coccomyxa sp. Obi]|nr:Smr domain-containing protein C11H11.03c [Coccomyxa sp. Obi]
MARLITPCRWLLGRQNRGAKVLCDPFDLTKQAPPGVGGNEHYRAEARKHAELRNQYYQQSQEAFRSGRKAEAKALSNKGKAEAALMEKANRLASDAAFQGNNKGRDSWTIDLHGLYVEEAVQRARESIAKARGEGKEHLIFIVGKGNHSAGGVQKLKPAIEKLSQEEGLSCIPDKPHDGCVWVVLDGEGKVADGVAAFFKGIASLFRKIFHKS